MTSLAPEGEEKQSIGITSEACSFFHGYLEEELGETTVFLPKVRTFVLDCERDQDGDPEFFLYTVWGAAPQSSLTVAITGSGFLEELGEPASHHFFTVSVEARLAFQEFSVWDVLIAMELHPQTGRQEPAIFLEGVGPQGEAAFLSFLEVRSEEPEEAP